jgi:hypothetical protein
MGGRESFSASSDAAQYPFYEMSLTDKFRGVQRSLDRLRRGLTPGCCTASLSCSRAVAIPIRTAKHPCNCAVRSNYVDLPLDREFDQTGRTRPAISGVTHKFASDHPVTTQESKIGSKCKSDDISSMPSLRDMKADWCTWTRAERFSARSFTLLTSGMVPALLLMGRG